jgi:hypothetical protein
LIIREVYKEKGAKFGIFSVWGKSGFKEEFAMKDEQSNSVIFHSTPNQQII